MSAASLREPVINVAQCRSQDKFYDLFFRAVGAPDWHGRNFNALRDSIATGQINQIEVPYRLIIANYDQIEPSAKPMADDFIDLIRELGTSGTPVEIRVETSK